MLWYNFEGAATKRNDTWFLLSENLPLSIGDKMQMAALNKVWYEEDCNREAVGSRERERFRLVLGGGLQVRLHERSEIYKDGGILDPWGEELRGWSSLPQKEAAWAKAWREGCSGIFRGCSELKLSLQGKGLHKHIIWRTWRIKLLALWRLWEGPFLKGKFTSTVSSHWTSQIGFWMFRNTNFTID